MWHWVVSCLTHQTAKLSSSIRIISAPVGYVHSAQQQCKMVDIGNTYWWGVVIEFPILEGFIPTEIHKHLRSVYGKDATDISSVICWAHHFERGSRILVTGSTVVNQSQQWQWRPKTRLVCRFKMTTKCADIKEIKTKNFKVLAQQEDPSSHFFAWQLQTTHRSAYKGGKCKNG